MLGKTQAEVKEMLKKAIADSQQMDMTRNKSYTEKSQIKLWYEVYAEPRFREKTKDHYPDSFRHTHEKILKTIYSASFTLSAYTHATA